MKAVSILQNNIENKNITSQKGKNLPHPGKAHAIMLDKHPPNTVSYPFGDPASPAASLFISFVPLERIEQPIVAHFTPDTLFSIIAGAISLWESLNHPPLVQRDSNNSPFRRLYRSLSPAAHPELTARHDHA